MKKKNSYIGLSLVILVFGIIFIPRIVDKITGKEVIDNNRSIKVNDGVKTNKELRLDNELATLKKIPAFRFINQHGDTISNSYYTDKVYVVEFFFSTCTDICPIMNTNMLKLQKEFRELDNFGIASFTIDPSYDTPEVLKAYAEAYEANHPHWNFLTGDKEAILELSNKGFNLYAAEVPETEGMFEHSGYFALIDQQGNIRSRIDENNNPIIYYDGLEDEGVEMLIEDIKKLL